MEDKNEVVDEILEEAEEVVADPVVEELKSTKDQLLRLAAEFDNFRKRSIKERDEISSRAKCGVIKPFLPVMDNFDRAACGEQSAQSPNAEAIQKGLLMIFEQFTGVFESLGVEAFGKEGEAFNPALHHAVAHKDDADLKECIIDEIYSKGYMVDGKLLREATVITRG